MTRRIHGFGLAAAIGVLGLMACGSAELTVIAVLGDDGDPNAALLGDLVVELLPYDRDQVFDSMEAAAARPQPEIPPDLLAAQEEIAQARSEWRDDDARWGVLRDTLNTINDELETLERGMRTYQELYNTWEDLSDDLAAAERARESSFERFTGLQDAAIGRMDSVRIVRADWADEAFADVNEVLAAKIEASGLDVAVDTTEVEGPGEGSVVFQVPPGDYWVHARYELPGEELYWNVRITVVRGEPMEVRLTRANAEARMVF